MAIQKHQHQCNNEQITICEHSPLCMCALQSFTNLPHVRHFDAKQLKACVNNYSSSRSLLMQISLFCGHLEKRLAKKKNDPYKCDISTLDTGDNG